MSTIDLNRVRLFVRVAEAGSFTGAARLSGLPTSSVSRAVAALERELAVRLIQRTTRRLQLTEAGRVYYESVSCALSGMDYAAAACGAGIFTRRARAAAPSSRSAPV